MWPRQRRKSKRLKLGELYIGGDAPIVVQSMNSQPIQDVEGNLRELERLKAAGCELSRLALPREADLPSFREIVKHSVLPLVADIHFDYRLALAALDAGVVALRLNPGNIRSQKGLKEVAQQAKYLGVPIRVGVNSGSIAPEILKAEGGLCPKALSRSALEAAELLEDVGFSEICLSLKASHAPLLIAANREVAKLCDYPLHLGLTEAGTASKGAIRSAAALAPLLEEGIGDTLRISLSADPVEEVKVAWLILDSLGLRKRGSRVISCPGCGRTQVDIQPMAEAVENYLDSLELNLEVAVMGCAVNGPGEAREADLGIAGGKGEYLIFAKGKPLYKVSEAEALEALKSEINKFIK